MNVLWIEKGTHTIVITREGYEPWQTEITVQNASNHSIDARLVPVATTVPATTRMGVGGGVLVLGVVLLWRRREG